MCSTVVPAVICKRLLFHEVYGSAGRYMQKAVSS